MTANPNPFADDLPQPGRRLQSAADPLNPYAAPASPEPQQRPEIVGVWRDGPLLVMHRRALLPELCVMSGEPTTKRHWETLRWSQPVDWGGRAMVVEYGIQPQILRMNTKFPLISVLCTIAVWLVVMTAVAVFVQRKQLVGVDADDAFSFGACVSSVLTALCFLPVIIARRQNKFIQLVHIEKHYVWLRGPGEAFLQTLPPWSEVENLIASDAGYRDQAAFQREMK